jgi:hypothetical protein
MPEMSCPNCRTLRAPNAVYCHVCGHVYNPGSGSTASRSAPSDWGEPKAHVTEHRMSFTTAVTIGAGLTIGALVVGLFGTVVSALIFGSLLNALVRSIPGLGG